MRSGETEEIFLYNIEQASQSKLLFSSPQPIVSEEILVSEDMDAIYFVSHGGLTPEAPVGAEDLYRYDVPGEKLSFIASLESYEGYLNNPHVSPDGRYFYFNQAVAGVPGGAGARALEQVFRYDSVENVVECISCASSFDPEPKLSSYLGGRGPSQGPNGREPSQNGLPNLTLMSANGDYAFFDTPAALVPQDIDGEVPPAFNLHGGGSIGKNEYESSEFSPSSDVYEWRREGRWLCPVAGLSCVDHIWPWGHLNMLLGSRR